MYLCGHSKLKNMLKEAINHTAQLEQKLNNAISDFEPNNRKGRRATYGQ